MRLYFAIANDIGWPLWPSASNLPVEYFVNHVMHSLRCCYQIMKWPTFCQLLFPIYGFWQLLGCVIMQLNFAIQTECDFFVRINKNLHLVDCSHQWTYDLFATAGFLVWTLCMILPLSVRLKCCQTVTILSEPCLALSYYYRFSWRVSHFNTNISACSKQYYF